MAKMTNNYVYHTPCLRNSSIFLLHRSKMVISWDVFSIFSKFWFSGLLVGKSAKKAQNNSKFCLSLHISGTILMWLWFLVHMCKRIFFPAFFWFFQIFDILHFREGEGCKIAKINHNYPFQSVTLPKNQKNQNFNKTKTKYWRYNHFTSVYQTPQSYEVPLWRYGVRDSIFGHFGPFFCLFISPALTTQKIKILKKWKKQCFIGFLSLKTLSHSWSPVYI